MRHDTVNLLQNPYTGEELSLEDEYLVSIESGKKFKIIDEIPTFLSNVESSRHTRMIRRLYDTVALAFDSVVKIGDTFGINSEGTLRRKHIVNLKVKPNDRVLETAIGTASNIVVLPKHGLYYGVDISMQMLRIGQRKLNRAAREADLFHGNGTYLPFKNNKFDLVFQVGGLQFYDDPRRGISEMARVTKPGTEVHIYDEIRGISSILKRISRKAKKKKLGIQELAQLVPPEMNNIQVENVPETDFYHLSFTKLK